MSMVDESPRYYIENGNFYHYTPSNLYLSAGFYTGTDAIRENLGDIHENKEKILELIENGYEIYDYDKKKLVEIEDVEILEKDKENLEQSGIEMGKHILSFNETLEAKEVNLMIHTIIAECCDWLAMNTNLSHDKIESCRNMMLTVKEEQLKAQKGE